MENNFTHWGEGATTKLHAPYSHGLPYTYLIVPRHFAEGGGGGGRDWGIVLQNILKSEVLEGPISYALEDYLSVISMHN